MERKLEIGRRLVIGNGTLYGKYGVIVEIDCDGDLLIAFDNMYDLHSGGNGVHGKYKYRCWYIKSENVIPCRRIVKVYDKNGEVINHD